MKKSDAAVQLFRWQSKKILFGDHKQILPDTTYLQNSNLYLGSKANSFLKILELLCSKPTHTLLESHIFCGVVVFISEGFSPPPPCPSIHVDSEELGFVYLELICTR